MKKIVLISSLLMFGFGSLYAADSGEAAYFGKQYGERTVTSFMGYSLKTEEIEKYCSEVLYEDAKYAQFIAYKDIFVGNCINGYKNAKN